MNYIVLDLEWNQGPHRSEPHKEPTFEIIEIGAMKLDQEFQELDIYQSLVKPQIYDIMHRYTAEIVDLDMRDLESERYFVEVAEEFLEWSGEDYIFCIWGVQDLTKLQKTWIIMR